MISWSRIHDATNSLAFLFIHFFLAHVFTVTASWNNLHQQKLGKRRRSQAKEPILTLTGSTCGGWACLLRVMINGHMVVILTQL